MSWRSDKAGAIATAACLGLFLSACGFHLRGASDRVPWPAALNPVHLKSARGTEDVTRELTQRLQEQYSVKLVDDGKNIPAVNLLSEQFQRRTLALNLTGKASEYLLRLRLAVQVQDAAGEVVVPQTVILVQRNFSYDSTQVLAMEAEQDRLRRDMVRDVVRQLLVRIAAQYPKGAS